MSILRYDSMIRIGTWVSLFVAAFFIALPLVPLGGRSLYAITSGSMSPTLSKGSLVAIAPRAEYSTGDIVTFRGVGDIPTTHRIVGIGEGETVFTQGDANSAQDPEPISISRVLGVVEFEIPILGDLLTYSRTRVGYTSLVLVPIFILCLIEAPRAARAIRQKPI